MTTNIHVVWRYHDGIKWCYEYKMDNIPNSWIGEAEQVRVRIIWEFEGTILKCEVLR